MQSLVVRTAQSDISFHEPLDPHSTPREAERNPTESGQGQHPEAHEDAGKRDSQSLGHDCAADGFRLDDHRKRVEDSRGMADEAEQNREHAPEQKRLSRRSEARLAARAKPQAGLGDQDDARDCDGDQNEADETGLLNQLEHGTWFPC